MAITRPVHDEDPSLDESQGIALTADPIVESSPSSPTSPTTATSCETDPETADSQSGVTEQVVPQRESRSGFVFLGIITVMLLVWLRIDLILTNTTPTGGDNGGHLWTADYVRRELLPHLRVLGWSNDWFGGVPVLNFYFPLPTWLIVGLSFILPYNIAFKIVTVLGIVTLPFAAVFMGRQSGLSRNRSLFLAYSVLPFLLARHFRILGGNIMSTMAGEFSFSLSLTLVVIYAGLLSRLLRTGQGRGRTALVLACAGLSHIVPTIGALLFTAAATIAQLRRSQIRRQLTDVAIAGSIGGAVAGFWIVPFAANLTYTNSMDYERVTKFFKVLFPFFHDSATQFTPSDSAAMACVALVLTAVAALFAIAQRDRFIASWILTMAFAGVAFRLAPQGAMWNIRLLPLWFFCAYLLAGQGLVLLYESIFKRLAKRLGRRATSHTEAPPSLPYRRRRIGQGATALASLALYVSVGPAFGVVPTTMSIPNFTDGSFGLTRLGRLSDVKKAPTPFGWAASNEQGMERKSGWKEYQALVGTLKTLPCGRTMWELAAIPKTPTIPKREAIRYGSSMSLMSLPYFTNSCTQSMEGLFFESSATAPFHWLTKSMVVEKSSNPQRRLPYPTFDIDRGIDRMRALGIRYYLPSTAKALAAAARSPHLREVARSEPYVVYEILDNAIVVPLREWPVVATGIGGGLETGFIDVGIAQWMDPAKFPGTITLDGPPEWQRRTVTITRTPGAKGALPKRGIGVSLSPSGPSSATSNSGTPNYSTESSDATNPDTTRRLEAVTVTNVKMKQLSISFSVDKIGLPVLVRISAFPNWKAAGAKGPYRSTPNFMVVIPTSKNVTLSYARSASERLGLIISGLGLVALISVINLDRRRRRGACSENVE